MRLAALLLLCVLMEDGRGVTAAPRFQSAQRTHSTGTVLSVLRRRGSRDLVLEDLCFTLRENEEQLLCNERRSKFNFNPLSLRFGKRHVSRRAQKTVLSHRLSPFYQDVPA